MLSLRVFGEDITKPHTANLKGKQPENTNGQDEDVVENTVEAEPKLEGDEESAINA